MSVFDLDAGVQEDRETSLVNERGETMTRVTYYVRLRDGIRIDLSPWGNALGGVPTDAEFHSWAQRLLDESAIEERRPGADDTTLTLPGRQLFRTPPSRASEEARQPQPNGRRALDVG